MKKLNEWEMEAQIIPRKDIMYDSSKPFGERFREYSSDRRILMEANTRVLTLIPIVKKQQEALEKIAKDKKASGFLDTDIDELKVLKEVEELLK